MTINDNSQQRSTILIGLIIIMAVILTVAGILFFKNQSPSTGKIHRITYQVESSGGYAYIIYTDSNGKNTDATMMATPFTRTVTLPVGTEVYLTASNPSQTGTIQCKIKLDNQEWKESHGTHPVDSVACGGIIK